jgi:hypothetical protein
LLPFRPENVVLSPVVQNVKVRIYKSIILPMVLYRCEIRAPTLRDEHKLRVFVNRVLRGILGPKRDGGTGGWRNPYNEELHD